MAGTRTVRGAGLRVIERPGRNTLYVRGTVRGTSVYESTSTADRELAEAYRAKRESELWHGAVFGARATVTFSAAVLSYLDAHPPSPSTSRALLKLVDHLGDRPLREIGQEAVDRAYKVVLTARAGPATRKRAVLTPLLAVLNHAARRGWCDRPAFESPRVPKSRTTILLPDQATALVREAAPHLRPLIVFLIGTGARMSEALTLDWRQVDLRAGRCVLWQGKTLAAGGRPDRHVDLPPVVIAALSALGHRDGRVFRTDRRRRGARDDAPRLRIKTGWSAACGRAGLPGIWRDSGRPDRPGRKRVFAAEHSPHDCRHTWASWHYALHRDVLLLKRDGGWSTVTMVERYAHLVAPYYREAIAAWLDGRPSQARATPDAPDQKTA